MKTIEFELTPNGTYSRVLVDGELVQGVTRVTVTVAVGQRTTFSLEGVYQGEPIQLQGYLLAKDEDAVFTPDP